MLGEDGLSVLKMETGCLRCNQILSLMLQTLILQNHECNHIRSQVWFSCVNEATMGDTTAGDQTFAVDDISFLNCDKSYQPPGKYIFTHMNMLESYYCGGMPHTSFFLLCRKPQQSIRENF